MCIPTPIQNGRLRPFAPRPHRQASTHLSAHGGAIIVYVDLPGGPGGPPKTLLRYLLNETQDSSTNGNNLFLCEIATDIVRDFCIITEFFAFKDS